MAWSGRWHDTSQWTEEDGNDLWPSAPQVMENDNDDDVNYFCLMGYSLHHILSAYGQIFGFGMWYMTI